MKSKFKNKSQQMSYINHFVRRNCDLPMICQYCGKEGHIKYYDFAEDPYLIHIICRDCKVKYKLNKKENKGKYAPFIPLIDIRDYNKCQGSIDRLFIIDDKIKEQIKYIMKSNFTKQEACAYMGITDDRFAKLIDKYNKEVDHTIKRKLDLLFQNNRKKVLLKSKLEKYKHNNVTSNRITYYKSINSYSNRDIEELSNGRIQYSSISNMVTGKDKPKIKTKCIFAEVFKVSVADIFSEDSYLTMIYSYNDYCKLNNKLRIKLKNHIDRRKVKEETHIIEKISQATNLRPNKLYDFLNGTDLQSGKEVELLSNYLKGVR